MPSSNTPATFLRTRSYPCRDKWCVQKHSLHCSKTYSRVKMQFEVLLDIYHTDNNTVSRHFLSSHLADTFPVHLFLVVLQSFPRESCASKFMNEMRNHPKHVQDALRVGKHYSMVNKTSVTASVVKRQNTWSSWLINDFADMQVAFFSPLIPKEPKTDLRFE